MAGVAWLVLPYVWSQGLGHDLEAHSLTGVAAEKAGAEYQTQAGEALRQHIIFLSKSLMPSEAQHPEKPTTAISQGPRR
jgi:hypothetical protein